ncbi:hypothetical protein LVJ94_00850 [Pendulispora rubella]|uniref:Uncharacterized protein n=1 Tax=Pendulispora rubella TaxID=2741070 RepID=A0ABZ2L4V3_9BACT
MNSDRDPPARLEDCSELDAVRRAIGAARADVPAQDRIGLLEAGLAAKLAALGGAIGGGFDGGAGGHGTDGGFGDGGAGAGAGGGLGSGGGLGAAGAAGAGAAGKTIVASFAAKVVGSAVLATGVATGGWYATHPADTPRPHVAVVASAAPAPPPPRPAQSAVISPEVPALPKTPDKVAPPKASSRVKEAPVESEVELLRRAQDQLSSDPRRALGLCDVHKEQYPNGDLAQEREVLAIDALLRLHRRSDAEARAERFERAYPTSAHRRRVDTLLTQ